MSSFWPHLTATRLQASTYLFGIALFSISFLVFLNSSISFVVTDVIGRKEAVGDAVGTLGFADELLALVACPAWGLLSDRIGVRTVAVMGYCIVGLSLICLVQSSNVYPQLLLGRLGFSLGGAACSTMVTAVLPAMVAPRVEEEVKEGGQNALNGQAARLREEDRPSRNGSVGHGATPSVSSELTITPVRYNSRSRSRGQALHNSDGSKDDKSVASSGTSQLAGFVGTFTGLGALIALAVFLPLPAWFQSHDKTPAQSVRYSFYIVGAVAFIVAVYIAFGLRNLPGEEGKSIRTLFSPARLNQSKTGDQEANVGRQSYARPSSYISLISQSVRLGFTDSSIALGYVGGFVARASSVGISLFIPLFVNAYFVKNGLCTSNPDNLTDVKENCQRAYKLASALTGIAETAALLCAPLFGWLGGKVMHGKSEWPLLGASALGIAGYVAFGLLKNPDAFHGDGGSWAILAVILVGISQIGAIVCSLGLLGRGINAGSLNTPSDAGATRIGETGPVEGGETAPLLPGSSTGSGQDTSRAHLKGSIAGVYSLAGGAGILLLTKLGGVLFDRWTPGAPFFMLAIFNAVLFVAVALIGGGTAAAKKLQDQQEVDGEVG